MSLIIGLTGGIASGKSTVSKMFQKLNIPVIDADVEAHLAVEKGEKAYFDIVSYFGKNVLMENGSIDRNKLGNIIFPDEEKRTVLNNIVHPAVRERMLEKKEQYIASGHNLVVLDIPLLFESKLAHMVDKVIVVYVNEKTQLDRLMIRNGYTKEEALSRMASQLPLFEKQKWADAVIDNNGTVDDTEKQLHDILNKWGYSY